jgi:hypothetical protein
MATIVRLPNPAMVDDFLRDLASVQKLKKALGQALQALEAGPKKQVEDQFKMKSAGQAVETFLQKGTPATSEDKGYLVWLISEIGHRAHVGLSFHPGFIDTRGLDDDEVGLVATAVGAIDQRVKQIADTNGYDTQISNVFGPAMLHEVKTRFKLSLEALIRIHKARKIVIDTMQKQKVWTCGGLTSETQIALPDKLKVVSQTELMLTLVHEMTHALPNSVRTSDKYYRHHEKFKTAKAQRKLITADYYAEVFDRVLKNTPGDVFVPTDASEISKQPNGLLLLYRGELQKLVNRAWAMAINIHGTLVPVGKWAQANQSGRFVPNAFSKTLHEPAHIDFLKNASRLLGLTIHKRGDLRGTINQVTALDLSIIDNKLNVLGRLQSSLGKTLDLPAGITSFEQTKVDQVFQLALRIENNKERPGLLSRDIYKDIIVIRSLANLNDAPEWKTWMGKLTKGLPEPMNSYAQHVF